MHIAADKQCGGFMLLEEKIQIHPVTMCFRGDQSHLESTFQDHYFKLSLPVFRWGFGLGILLYALFSFLDAVSMPLVKQQLWRIRFFFVIPVILSGILFSFHPSFKKYWQLTIVFIIFVASTGILWMIVVGYPPNNYSYYTGIILVFFFLFAFIRTRFIWALPTSIVILILFEFTILKIASFPFAMAFRSSFFLISAIIIGVVACYSMEYFARKNYFLMIMLDREKEKLSDTNRQLESHIEELQKAHQEIKILSGLIPICAKCKKIRDDQGYWNQIESYISKHSSVVFSHALCPECAHELYGHEEWFKPSAN